MPGLKMHAHEVDIDAALVARLVAASFPQWAHLAIEPVHSSGTDHAMYRLGDDLAARLPRIVGATTQGAKEHRWLPLLAHELPLDVPLPVGRGEPADGYPWQWSVCRWLDGDTATVEQLAGSSDAAAALAGFVTALQRVDATGGPSPGDHNVNRGVPLAVRDAATRDVIAALADQLDADALTAAWDAAVRAPEWDGPPVWIHGDLQPTNLLTQHSRLSAVIDFGCLGVGDPACDLMAAWNLFSDDARDAFHAGLRIDDATWARGRGWALSVALIALPYYQHTSPAIAAGARYTIAQVLDDSDPDS